MIQPAERTVLARSLAAREEFIAVAQDLSRDGMPVGEVVADMAAALGMIIAGVSLPGQMVSVLDQATSLTRETALMAVDIGGQA
jgi:hypothetical protein